MYFSRSAPYHAQSPCLGRTVTRVGEIVRPDSPDCNIPTSLLTHRYLLTYCLLRHLHNISDNVWVSCLAPDLTLAWQRKSIFFLIATSCLLLEIGVYSFSNLVLLHCRQILYHLSHQGSPITSHSSTKTVINWQNFSDNLSLIISTSLINPFFFPIIYDKKNVEGKAKEGESLYMIFRSCHCSVQGFPFRSNYCAKNASRALYFSIIKQNIDLIKGPEGWLLAP